MSRIFIIRNYIFSIILLLILLDNGCAQLNISNAGNSSTLRILPRQARRVPTANGCLTTDGGSGTCMTRFNCMRIGGTIKGFCSTYGVCCETNLQCNRVSNLKRTIIRNPTQLVDTTCRYTFTPYSSNVCQLLVEFQNFQLQQPTIDGNGAAVCEDSLKINGFTLCGQNSQQHLYIPFNNMEQVSFEFYLPNLWALSSWNLVVTQLECPKVKKQSNTLLSFINGNNINDVRTVFSAHNSDLDLLAPTGCDQYYTQPSGNIKSFNFDGISSLYMANLDYTICIKSTGGANLIEYTLQKFSLNTGGQFSEGYDTDCHPTVYTVGREDDYLMIPQSYLFSTPDMRPIYYCGEIMSGTGKIVAMPPFIMAFHSDQVSNAVELGFNINYQIQTTLVGF